MIINIAIVILILVIIATAVYGISQLISVIFGSPYYKSQKNITNAIIKLANFKSGDIFYDLGCGSGEILKVIADKFNIKATGMEISPLPYIKAKIITMDNKNIHILWHNLLSVDLTDVDVVFCYLLPSMMKKLEKKFIKQMKPGAKLISNSFALPNIKPKQVIQDNMLKLYFYEF